MPEGMIETLVSAARKGVERRSAAVPLPQLEEQLQQRSNPRPFVEALSRPGLSVVAEFKRRSPSAGEIRPGAEIEGLVKAYEEGGAAALSVLTEEEHFGGSLEDLRVARRVSELPILRKDFIVEPYQLYEAATAGADAVLLIVAALEPDELDHLHREAREIDLDCLVEVHDENELETALEIGAEALGINNRNLDDFSVDLDTTFELITDVPAGKPVVSESGIETAEQLAELTRVGVDAVLIGESLMRAADPETAVGALISAGEEQTGEHPL